MKIDKEKLNNNIKQKYQIADNTFSFKPKDDWRDRIEVEIGDVKQPDNFFPQLKIKRFDNEVNYSIRFKDDSSEKETIEYEEEKIKWKKGNKEVHLYDKPEISENGGHEFEVILKEKPKTNILEFSIETKGLDFFYQPALTATEIAEGAFRPENVIDSYAVYYKDCPANYVDGKLYRTGKAFHIYRIKATDANGISVWGKQNIDVAKKLHTIEIPHDFLDKAVYPVVVDPTFGYTGTGSSSTTLYNRKKFSKFNLSEVGTVSKITVRCWQDGGDGGTVNIKAGIFDDDSPYSMIINGGEVAVTEAYPSHNWYDFVLETGVELTADDWWFGAWGDNGNSFEWPYIRYDNTTGTIYWKEVEYVSGTADWTYEQDNSFQGILSIYATYTAAGSASASPSISPSTSTSDSPSSSPSPSTSPSTSESISPSLSESVSPSLSESTSESVSPSVSSSSSISASTSESISPSISASTSESISPSLSESISESVSPSSSPSEGFQGYTKGDEINLPSTISDLETAFSEQDYIDVAAKDDITVSQSASEQYTIFQFKDYVGALNSINIEWEGQTNNPPFLSPVYLQIYNRNTTEWETIDSDNTTNEDIDFILTANIEDLTNYKDENTVIVCRVYQQG